MKFKIPKIKLQENAIIPLIIVTVSTLIILGSYFRVFETFELATLDLRFQNRPAQKLTDNVVIIEIAEDTLNRLGEWPIDRGYYALLIDILSAYGAKAIVMDILFGQSSVSDPELIDSVKNSGIVYIPMALRLPDSKDKIDYKKDIFPRALDYESVPIPKLKQASRGIGHVNATTDIDGKRRRIPLFLDLKSKLVPQISFLCVLDYLNIKIKDIKVNRFRHIEISPEISIPIDSQGYTFVNFAGRWGQAFPHYSFVDVLTSYTATQRNSKSAIDLEELRGKICLVGLTAVATHDLDPIPLQERYPQVGVHANLMNTIFTNNFIIRANRLANLCVLILLLAVAILVTLRLRPILSMLVTVGVFFGFLIMSFLLFGFFNIWIDLFYPILLIPLVYVIFTLYKYIREQQKRILMQRDLDIAQRIQKSFLKETAPEFEGLDIGVCMTPAKTVGGDLYDFVKISDTELGIMVGDVSGKGMPAALFMAMTVSNFRFHSRDELDPVKVVTKLNDQIATESTSGLFITLSYLMVDTKAKNLSIVDAGHLPVVYAGKDKETSLIESKGGMALGIMDGVEFTKIDVNFASEDVFVLYTDGVTEARNSKKDEFEEERLKKAVSKNKHLSATEITKAIYEELVKFKGRAPQHDDITIMALKIK